MGTNLLRTIQTFRDDVYGVTHQAYVPWRLAGVRPDSILRCDIVDYEQVQKIFQKYHFKTVFALAAYGSYARQDRTRLIYQTNVLGLISIIEAAAGTGFSRLVHAGASSEYGFNCRAPLEDDVLKPNSHYAVSKVSASYLLGFLGHTQSLPVVNLRFYSLYGPWEDPERLIPRLLMCGMRGHYPPLVDPDISRDFVFVDDATHAMLSAAVPGKCQYGSSINVATGKKTTIREIAALAKEMFDIREEPRWNSMLNRSWDLKEWVGNPDAAREILDWEATTDLREGLRRTAEWIKQRRTYPIAHPLAKVQAPPRISAVIACYRDSEAIPVMYERLTKVFRSLNVDFEIIFVNDASPDSSDEVLREITERDPQVIAIEHSRNFGSQNAFLSGMAIATGDAVVLLDGDLQDPPEVIADFYHKWLEGYEIVYGKRVKRQMSLLMNLSYKLFYRCFRAVSYVPIPVDAGDFSLMDRKAVNEILSLPEADQFLRGLRAWVGFRQTGIEYVRPDRKFGKSTNSWHRNFWWARKAIFSFSFAPLECMMYAGIALTLLSFVLLACQIVGKIVWPEVPQGITSIIVLILFFGGVQVLGMSILGEYLSKVFEESKRRPKYIRRALRYLGNHFTSADDIAQFIRQRKRA